MEPSDTRDQLKGTSQNKGLGNATSASTNPSPLKDASLAATSPAELDYAHKNSLKGHKASIAELTTLPDGRLVSGSADGTLIVWRAMTDQELTQAQTEQTRSTQNRSLRVPDYPSGIGAVGRSRMNSSIES